MQSFSGIWIPLVTPFADGDVDYEALRTLVRNYAEAGVSGFVALGTTGEPAALDRAEQDTVLRTILDAAGDTPVIAGLAGNNTSELRERVVQLSQEPVAGVLISAPYYIRPAQTGLIDHFVRLADVSAKPIVLYEIPYRTGVRMELDTLRILSQHSRIQAIKDCSGSIDITLALILDGRLQVLAGDDINIYATLCFGGAGAIAATAHIRPEWFVAMYRAVASGQLAEARGFYHRLVPIIQALTMEPNPSAVKAALAAEGLIRDELRAPMSRATDAFRNRWNQIVGERAA